MKVWYRADPYWFELTHLGKRMECIFLWRGKIRFKKMQEDSVVLVVEKNLSLFNAAIVHMVVAVLDIRLDSVFRWHARKLDDRVDPCQEGT